MANRMQEPDSLLMSTYPTAAQSFVPQLQWSNGVGLSLVRRQIYPLRTCEHWYGLQNLSPSPSGYVPSPLKHFLEPPQLSPLSRISGGARLG